MKKYITQEDIDQLSESAKIKYEQWCIAHDLVVKIEETDEEEVHDVPLWEIGDMIEFLYKNRQRLNEYGNRIDGLKPAICFSYLVPGEDGVAEEKLFVLDWDEGIEACDVLWEKSKEILEQID